MGGGELIRGALDAGVVQELRWHLAPLTPGGGTPLFAEGAVPRQLRQIHVRPSAHAVHLTYRID